MFLYPTGKKAAHSPNTRPPAGPKCHKFGGLFLYKIFDSSYLKFVLYHSSHNTNFYWKWKLWQKDGLNEVYFAGFCLYTVMSNSSMKKKDFDDHFCRRKFIITTKFTNTVKWEPISDYIPGIFVTPDMSIP